MSPRLLRIAVVLATLAILAGLLASTALLLGRMRATAEDNARATVERVAGAAEAAVNRSFLAVDGALAGLPAILGAGAAPLEREAASRMLRELNFQNLGFRDMGLLLPDGRPWATALPASRNRPPPIEAASLAEARRGTGLVVSGPVRNPLTGEWALFLLRGVRLGATGEFVAVAELPVTLVGTLLGPVAEATGLRLTVETTAGRLLVSLPHDEARIGQSLTPIAGILPLDGRATRMRGRFVDQAVFAAARPSLYRDILVVASYALPAALEAYAQDRRRLLLGTALAAALIAALAGALYAVLRQRERVEAERAAARQLLESALESMPDGFVMWDAEDRLVVCNQRYREIYAISAPFILPGVRFTDLIRAGARRGQYPQCGEDIEAFVAEVTAWHHGNAPPMERLLPDGTWLLVTERGLPGGGTVGIRTDITALKRANADLAAARDAAAAAAVAKSRFLARMSHDLRTPLNGVLGLAQVLARDPALSGEQRERARTLEKAGRHAVAVANDVLDLAKIESGLFELRAQPTALVSLLEECVALFASAAAAKSVRLALRAAPGLPARVATDQTRLRQLMLNLLSNAVKFTPAGGRVDVRVLPLPDAGEAPLLVRLEVRDTGPGIPAAMRSAIFGDFVQLDPNRDSGTGLGLAIAAGIVQQMRGRIGCEPNSESAAPGGAVFWVEVPMQPLAEEAVAPTHAAAPQPVAAGPLHVLVADDVPANLAVARALLGSAGHTVECVTDGAEAVEALEAAAVSPRPFDAVLMDVMMPGLDGLEAARRIRALPGPERRVPILAVTASAFAEDIAACREAGMDAHLAKPIEREALLAALVDLVRAAAPGMALPVARPRPRAFEVPGLDAAATKALAAAFLAEMGEAAAALAAAGSPAEVVPAAHRLAGAAATLEAMRLAEAARQLQREAAGLDPAVLAERRAALLVLVAEALALFEPEPAA